jgi:hypothetical protein
VHQTVTVLLLLLLSFDRCAGSLVNTRPVCHKVGKKLHTSPILAPHPNCHLPGHVTGIGARMDGRMGQPFPLLAQRSPHVSDSLARVQGSGQPFC